MATLYPILDGRSPESAGFSVESSEASMVFHVKASELQEAVEELLGTTKPNGTGGLDRSLPRHHPKYPFLYCSSVDVQGIGTGTDAVLGDTAGAADAVTSDLDSSPAVSRYWEYARYQLRCKFTQRPYAVLGNDSISNTNTTYYTRANAEVSVVCPEEWLRYTDVICSPNIDIAHAQHGMMKFYTGDGAAPGSNTNTHYTFSGFPRIVVPKSEVVINWYQVPESYLFSRDSALAGFIGRINQLEWYGWLPGELLYLGVKVTKRYTPPFPRKLTTGGGFSHEKLYDLALTFEETVREQDNVPDYGALSSTTLENRSYVAAGHNLQPFLGGNVTGGSNTAARGFYYAGTADNSKAPVFDSCNMAELFRDPDVA